MRPVDCADQFLRSKSSTGYVENNSEKWRSDLRQWKKSLPAEFKIDTMDPKDSRYRPTFHLYLNYYYAWITMGKVALVTVARTNLRNRTHPSSELSKPSEYSLSESQSCVKAARKLLLLFETLTKHRKITRFSLRPLVPCIHGSCSCHPKDEPRNKRNKNNQSKIPVGLIERCYESSTGGVS